MLFIHVDNAKLTIALKLINTYVSAIVLTLLLSHILYISISSTYTALYLIDILHTLIPYPQHLAGLDKPH